MIKVFINKKYFFFFYIIYFTKDIGFFHYAKKGKQVNKNDYFIFNCCMINNSLLYSKHFLCNVV